MEYRLKKITINGRAICFDPSIIDGGRLINEIQTCQVSSNISIETDENGSKYEQSAVKKSFRNGLELIINL